MARNGPFGPAGGRPAARRQSKIRYAAAEPAPRRSTGRRRKHPIPRMWPAAARAISPDRSSASQSAISSRQPSRTAATSAGRSSPMPYGLSMRQMPTARPQAPHAGQRRSRSGAQQQDPRGYDLGSYMPNGAQGFPQQQEPVQYAPPAAAGLRRARGRVRRRSAEDEERAAQRPPLDGDRGRPGRRHRSGRRLWPTPTRCSFTNGSGRAAAGQGREPPNKVKPVSRRTRERAGRQEAVHAPGRGRQRRRPAASRSAGRHRARGSGPRPVRIIRSAGCAGSRCPGQATDRQHGSGRRAGRRRRRWSRPRRSRSRARRPRPMPPHARPLQQAASAAAAAASPVAAPPAAAAARNRPRPSRSAGGQ